MKKIIYILTFFSFFSCTPKYPLKLGNNFSLDYNSYGYTSVYYNKNSIVIYGDVMGYNFDDNFIIIETKPIELINIYINKLGISKLNEADLIIKNSKLRQYWIIKKNELPVFVEARKTYSNNYGPFDKKTFELKKVENKIYKNFIPINE